MVGHWLLCQQVAKFLQEGTQNKLNIPNNEQQIQNSMKRRGLTANLPELNILVQNFSPAAICLQETMQNEVKPINL